MGYVHLLVAVFIVIEFTKLPVSFLKIYMTLSHSSRKNCYKYMVKMKITIHETICRKYCNLLVIRLFKLKGG